MITSFRIWEGERFLNPLNLKYLRKLINLISMQKFKINSLLLMASLTLIDFVTVAKHDQTVLEHWINALN